MKILYIPLDYHRHSEDDRFFGDMLRAFQRHSEAIIYTNIDNAIAFKPDVVFYHGSLSKEDCIKIKLATGCKWTMWTGDARYAPIKCLVDAMEFTDQYYLPFKGEMKDRFAILLGKPCSFIWEKFSDWKFREPKEMNGGTISFVGNVYDSLPGGEERVDLMNFCNRNIPDCLFYGSLPGSPNNKGGIHHNSVPDLYNNSFAVIVENNIHDIEGYFTPRNIMGLASGSCCLMKVFPGIEEHFENWKHCIYYRHKHELLDIVHYLRDKPEMRNKIAVAGHKLAKKKYTMDNFVKQYISQL
ncbi:MAG: glycosyltransferase [Bacteroidota bacterium]